MRDELRRRRRQQLKKAARQERRGGAGPEVGLDRLRGLACEAPSARVWAQLCAAVDALPGDDRLEVALGYLEAHMEAAGWPDALRTSAGLPQSWLRRAAAGLAEPRLRLVRTLALGEGGMDAATLRYLGETPVGAHLRGLSWRGEGLWSLWESAARPAPQQDAALVAALVEGGLAQRLERVTLRSLCLPEAALEHLMGALAAGRVTAVELRGCGLGERGLLALAQPGWAALERLAVGSGIALDAATEHVAGGARMRRFDFGEVEEVRLERGSPALWAAWAAAPWRGGLRSLALRDVVGLGGAGLATLLHPRAAWTALEELEVTRCGLDDPDAATLRAASLPALRRLDLRGNLLGPATRRALRAWADAQGIALLLEHKEPRDEE